MGRLISWTAACPVLLLTFSFSSLAFFSTALVSPDTMDRAGSVRDGETLVSAGGWFELGFFTPGGGSTEKYLCVRFNKGGQDKPIVWVANREQPLHDSTGVVTFGADGNLVVLDRPGGTVFWSTELGPDANGSRVAQLLDSGNLVVRGTDGGVILWQSFDEPGDTLLPGIRLLVNTETGASRRLTSWATPGDPSPGKYSYGLEVDKLPRLVLREGPSTVKFSTGFFNGVRFTGFQPMNTNGYFNSTVVSTDDEWYYTDTMVGNSGLVRVLLDPSGQLQRHVWTEETGTWSRLWTVPGNCEQYALCGPYGTCAESTFPICQCLRGFRPSSPQEWSLSNGTAGCVRETRLGCGAGDVFQPVTNVKLPELDNSSTVRMGMSLEECRERCAGDCSCTAYAAAADVTGAERGCITWSGDLVTMWNLSNSYEKFYLRVAASDPGSTYASDSRRKKSNQLRILASVVSVVSVIVLLLLYVFWMKRKTEHKAKTGRRKSHDNGMVDVKEMELRLFNFKSIILATNNFSIDNKIGEGGFGTVYKGTMEDGQEVAVKRLSCTSVQGAGEFMNEVKLIVKLQHNNLVQLLGCCIQEDERMLIFEYMQNKSLDLFIFDETKRGLLGWRMRLNIILGTARGLLYLHHDSRFKIIHRDLKASNILLDGAMNPKIADFGTARIIGVDQQAEKTKRVIGTFGYMSPEYAMHGIFSVKSDVFSFGVLVLEVLSGIRSRGIYETEPHLNLLSHAWKLWQEGKCLEFLDPMVMCSSHEIELLRYIQVGLLCVQEHATNRPTMSEVVMMLGSENFPLPEPRKLGFLLFSSLHSAEASSSRRQEPPTTNEMTITIILGR